LGRRLAKNVRVDGVAVGRRSPGGPARHAVAGRPECSPHPSGALLLDGSRRLTGFGSPVVDHAPWTAVDFQRSPGILPGWHTGGLRPHPSRTGLTTRSSPSRPRVMKVSWSLPSWLPGADRAPCKSFWHGARHRPRLSPGRWRPGAACVACETPAGQLPLRASCLTLGRARRARPWRGAAADHRAAGGPQVTHAPPPTTRSGMVGPQHGVCAGPLSRNLRRPMANREPPDGSRPPWASGCCSAAGC